jgi:cell division protein FtsZ
MSPDNVVSIKVIGVGGAGNNAVDRMLLDGTNCVEFVSVNTDKPALARSQSEIKLQIGAKLTKGQGAGADPEVGKKAAEESRNDVAKILENTDMVFIACGMGGGTGTGAAPIIADAAHEAGILTVGVVTKPFKFEAPRRMRIAEEGIRNLYDKVDALFVIPNENLKTVTEQKITLQNAFKIADEVLKKSVVSISELVKRTDMINLDFADITTIMKNSGKAHMGVGRAAGKDKAEKAAEEAISSPLMETSIEGAQGVIIHVMGSSDLPLEDVYTAAEIITNKAHPDANVIFGAGFDDELDDEIRVTVIATRFPKPDDESGEEFSAAGRPAAAEPVPEPARDKLYTEAPEDAEPPPVARREPPKVQSPVEDDDPFIQISDIFNKR